MKQIINEQRNNRIEMLIRWGLFAGLIILLIPLLAISFYNFPFSDDFAYGLATHETIVGGGNVFQVIGSAVKTAYKTYFTWQGSYFACFLMALNPAIWGENYYFIGTFLLLLSFVGTEVFFFNEVMKLLSFDKNKIRIISYMIIIGQILFVPDIVESFYWYNGAVYYTFFLSLSMLLGALMLKRKERLELDKKVHFISAIIIIIMFLISGGNYPMALTLNILLITIFILNSVSKRKVQIFQMLVAFAGVLGLVVSVLSPGNQARQNHVEGLNAIESILESFFWGAKFASSWVHIYVIAIFLFLIPFIWSGLKKTKFQFPLPGVVITFTSGLFCALYTPTLYGMATTGPPRLVCMIYYIYYIILLFDLIYLMGWVKKKDFSIFKREKSVKGWLITSAWILLCVVLFVASLGMQGIKYTNPVLAALEIKNGNAEAFRQENLERFRLLKDPELEIVILEDFKVKPHVIYLSELEDEDNYKNRELAIYYQKEAVKLRSYCIREYD